MKRSLKEPNVLWRGVITFCFVTALLSPLVWLYFTQFISNPFALDGFTRRAFGVCLGGMAVPLMLNLLAWGLQRKWNGYRRGWLLAVCCFVLGALCWLFTLGANWFSWNAAADLGRITEQQCRRLCLCSLLGLVCTLVPLIPPVVTAARSKGKETE